MLLFFSPFLYSYDVKIIIIIIITFILILDQTTLLQNEKQNSNTKKKKRNDKLRVCQSGVENNDTTAIYL